MGEAFLPNPAMRFTFQREHSTAAGVRLSRLRSSGPASPTFRRSFSTTFCARTGGRAPVWRPIAANGGYRDEIAVVRDLKVPLAVLHGADEQFVNGHYFASLAMPTLWRGAVQTIPAAGHTPQWETAAGLRCALAAFIAEMA